MKAAARLALCIPLLAGPALAACATGRASAQQPEAREAPPPPGDGRAQLVRSLEVLKQPGVKAEEDTQEARSVLDAIRGSPEMQRDGGAPDH